MFKHRLPSVFLLSLALATSGFAAEGTAAESLVSNGNFDTDSKGVNWPDGWGSEPKPGISWLTEEGKHFMRLQQQTPGKMLMLYRAVPIPAGTAGLEIGFRYRTAGVQRGAQPWFDARAIFHFLDASGKPVKPDPKPVVFKATEWAEASEQVVVPQGAAQLEMMPALFQAAAGTLDIAEVRVTPLDQAAVQSLKDAADALAAKKAAAAIEATKKSEAKVDAQLAATGSLLFNGDFEQARKNPAWPDGWGKGPTPGISWEVENGKHFLRLHQEQPGKMLMLYQLVPLKPTIKAIEVSTRYRTAGVKPGEKPWFDTRTILHFKGAGGEELKPAPGAIVFSSKAADWTTVSKRYIVPQGAAALEMMPALFQVAAGTLDISEFRVAPLKESEADAMITANAEATKKKADQDAILAKMLAMPSITKELKVSGNKLVTADGKPVLLQGLALDSMEWGPGDNILWTVKVAIDDWKANVVRLAVHQDPWMGRPLRGNPINQQAYIKTVDDAVKLAASKGAYLLLDLHAFGAPTQQHLDFWKNAAERYKNNPAVLFELFNEPHGISWEIWRNGGDLNSAKNKSTDVNPAENKEKQQDTNSVGMQALVDAVRATGAKNIILAGCLDWSYDLTGVVNGYALDDKGGNGIMYVAHIYPWKTGWKDKVLVAAEKYPVIVTEVGCPRSYDDFSFIKPNERHPLEGWAEDMIGMMQKYKLNWTGFSFHPRCGPMVIQDWDYTPTPYWGVYVKEALAGKTFEMKQLR